MWHGPNLTVRRKRGLNVTRHKSPWEERIAALPIRWKVLSSLTEISRSPSRDAFQTLCCSSPNCVEECAKTLFCEHNIGSGGVSYHLHKSLTSTVNGAYRPELNGMYFMLCGGPPSDLDPLNTLERKSDGSFNSSWNWLGIIVLLLPSPLPCLFQQLALSSRAGIFCRYLGRLDKRRALWTAVRRDRQDDFCQYELSDFFL